MAEKTEEKTTAEKSLEEEEKEILAQMLVQDDPSESETDSDEQPVDEDETEQEQEQDQDSETDPESEPEPEPNPHQVDKGLQKLQQDMAAFKREQQERWSELMERLDRKTEPPPEPDEIDKILEGESDEDELQVLARRVKELGDLKSLTERQESELAELRAFRDQLSHKQQFAFNHPELADRYDAMTAQLQDRLAEHFEQFGGADQQGAVQTAANLIWNELLKAESAKQNGKTNAETTASPTKSTDGTRVKHTSTAAGKRPGKQQAKPLADLEESDFLEGGQFDLSNAMDDTPSA